jgi:glycosyltransferase involved in cell wall biosynthesis
VIDVLQVYFEPIQSGQTTHVISLSHELRRRGYRVTVAMPKNLLVSHKAIQQVGVYVFQLEMRKILWRPSALHSIGQLVRKASIVHVHSQEAGLVVRLVNRLVGSKAIVYTPQTVDIRQKRYQNVYQFVEKMLAIVTHKIISVNSSDRNRLIQWGIPEHKVVTIPNGIDLSKFNNKVNLESIRQQLGLVGSGPVVMQIGRLTEQKDPLSFVHGAAQIAKLSPNAQFVLLGEGPLRSRLVSFISDYGLEGRIHLAGYHEDAWKFIPVSDVVTLTSRWEGLPYSLMEAMGWAKPIVTTSVNGCSDLVCHVESGFLVAPGDITSWVQHVEYLLHHSDKAQEMGCKGRALLRSRFSLNAMVDQVEALYTELLNSNKPGL